MGENEKGAALLCGAQYYSDEKCWQASAFKMLVRLLPVFYLWVLPWLLMKEMKTQRWREVDRSGVEEAGKQSHQPSIWEDLLLKVLIALPAAYTVYPNIYSEANYLFE